MGLSELK